MIYLWASLLVGANAVWLFLNLLMLPGNWMMLATTMLVGWYLRDAEMFSAWTLVAVVLLAVLGEVLEFFASMIGVRSAGGSRWSAAASLFGAILGAVLGTFLIPLPVFGSLLGACGGACIAAWCIEITVAKKAGANAMRSALGAGVGRFAAAAIKFTIGVVIWIIIAIAAYWP